MKKKLTVIQLLPELNAGGVERGTLEVAQFLVENGHRSIVVSNGGRLVDELEEMGSKHFKLPIHKKSFSSYFQVMPLVHLIDEMNPDIIHVRSRMPAWIVRYALKKCRHQEKIKLVSTVHGLYSVNRYSRIMTRADQLIAVSETVKRYILDNYPEVEPDKIKVIYRGVDNDSFSANTQLTKEWLEKWHREFPHCKDKKILTLPGRITRLKGHHEFLQLISTLKNRGHSIHGFFVGDIHPKKKSYYKELKKEIQGLGLEHNVDFTRQRNDISEIYQISDIIYSLSNKPESFGRTVLEALVQGKMVIGWDHGGVQEILSRLFPQGKVNPFDLPNLVNTTERLLNSPQKPEHNNPFTRDSMLHETLKLYRDISSQIEGGEANV